MMSDTTEQTITIELAQADREIAFGSATDEELADTDIEASIATLDRLTLAVVRETFPDAEVELGQGFHIWPETWFDETRFARDVAEIAEDVHRRGDWIVYRSEGN